MCNNYRLLHDHVEAKKLDSEVDLTQYQEGGFLRISQKREGVFMIKISLQQRK